MFKKKCKCRSCLFLIQRTNRCYLDKKSFLLCKLQSKNNFINLRDIRMMSITQNFLENHPRSLSNYMDEEYHGL